MSENLLEVRDLVKHFPVQQGVLASRLSKKVRAVDGVSFNIKKGETLGLVGESGSGKSTAGRAIMRLLEPTSGSVRFEDIDVLALKGKNLKEFRRKVQIIFQDPYASLNPRMTIAEIITEPLKIHRIGTSREQIKQAKDLLDVVGLNPEHINRYPHEFSGGQRQRIGIARALALTPDLLVCDEPIAALDVSIQAQIIALLKSLCREHGTAIMLVTHDMGVIAETADRVAVMYAGRIVEIGPVADVIHHPRHPYTAGLMGSIPSVTDERERLEQIDGSMPRLNAIPPGCAFNPRCPKVQPRCTLERPDLFEAGSSQAACWLHAPGASQ